MSKSNGQADVNLDEQQKQGPEHELPAADPNETLQDKQAEVSAAGQNTGKPNPVISDLEKVSA